SSAPRARTGRAPSTKAFPFPAGPAGRPYKSHHRPMSVRNAHCRVKLIAEVLVSGAGETALASIGADEPDTVARSGNPPDPRDRKIDRYRGPGQPRFRLWRHREEELVVFSAGQSQLNGALSFAGQRRVERDQPAVDQRADAARLAQVVKVGRQ